MSQISAFLQPLIETNPIWIKESKEALLHHTRLVRANAVAIVVIAFDKASQAESKDCKVKICTRAYKLLIE